MTLLQKIEAYGELQPALPEMAWWREPCIRSAFFGGQGS